MIVTLPLSPTDSIPIDNSRFSIQISEDRITYFSNLQPFDCHPIKHQRDMLMRIGRLNVVSHVPQQHLIEDFAVSRSTVQRAAGSIVNRCQMYRQWFDFIPRVGTEGKNSNIC